MLGYRLDFILGNSVEFICTCVFPAMFVMHGNLNSLPHQLSPVIAVFGLLTVFERYCNLSVLQAKCCC